MIALQVNHLAPFYLTELLLPNLKKAYKDTGDLSRVVLVASGTHRWANANGKGAVRYHLFLFTTFIPSIETMVLVRTPRLSRRTAVLLLGPTPTLYNGVRIASHPLS